MTGRLADVGMVHVDGRGPKAVIRIAETPSVSAFVNEGDVS
jgi:hypothetical protein